MTTARQPSTSLLFAVACLAAVLTLIGICALPHGPFIRWQAMRTEAYARFGWIYERVHGDRTPIDIAVIGTSHSMNGIDGAVVADTIAQRGRRGADGRCLTVTNFAMPNYGRNLHWEIAREILENRPVGTLVLEVLENETRKAHPLFSHVATTADLIGAPILLNQNYLADLVRLPYRQLSLFVESALPGEFGLKSRFDPASYDGSTVDNTRVVNVNGQAVTPPRDTVMDPAKLLTEATQLNADKRLNMLPKSLERFEYAVPDTYVARTLALARAKGTRVYLMYLPRFGVADRPVTMRSYPGYPMLSLNDILARPTYWFDAQHLNAQGAQAASVRLGALLASRPDLRGAPVATPPDEKGCPPGYPARTDIKPLAHHAR